MQLNEEGVENAKLWCLVCKQGELREAHNLIHYNFCKIQLDLGEDKVVPICNFAVFPDTLSHLYDLLQALYPPIHDEPHASRCLSPPSRPLRGKKEIRMVEQDGKTMKLLIILHWWSGARGRRAQ